MCRTVGNIKKLRFKTECIEDELTQERQFKGAQCGCCGDDGSGSADSCPALCLAEDACTKVDDETGVTENGSYMCMSRGNSPRGGKTICVVGEEETLKKQAQGLATCGCCGNDG